mmetsp:Transcript_28148/g.95894  ORF Transcript_28148/g.95894 Transcript_28148/m.95894 type:complete len:289 (-) Transcript_28148:74-940(-)
MRNRQEVSRHAQTARACSGINHTLCLCDHARAARLAIKLGSPTRPFAQKSSCSRYSMVARAAKPTSAGSTCSSGLWLTPPLHRTNIMLMGHNCATARASWPAPLTIVGSWAGSSLATPPVPPSAVAAFTAAFSLAVIAASLCTASASCLRSTSHRTPRRAHSASTAPVTSVTTTSRSSSLRLRMSTVMFTLPAMTLLAPGHMCTSPTVHTSIWSGEPPPSLHLLSTATTASAAAASASTLCPIGTVPAWPCTPYTHTISRVCPAMPSTVPTGVSSASSWGPCSMCTSR